MSSGHPGSKISLVGMIGCTSGGRGGGGVGGGGSRNPAFAASTTPISESLEMVTKHSWIGKHS